VRAAWIRAEREAEVRQAARAWRQAGAIGERELAAVETLFPAAWPDPSWLWSILAFVFVSFAVVGLFAAILISTKSNAAAAIAFVLAVPLAIAADLLRPSASGASAASGAAAAFWAVVCLLIGTADASGWGEHSLTLLLITGTAAWALAAWRWGYFVFTGFSCAFFFLSLARLAQGRLLWLVVGAALVLVCLPRLDRPALAPSHRRGLAAILAVCLVAVYVALNVYSLDHRILESLVEGTAPADPSAGARAAAAVATAAFPVFVLAWGILSRRTLVLDLGIAFAALSLATLRFYVHLGPLWAVLAVAGAGLVGLTLAIHRWLSRSPHRQRRGFTADALFENEQKQQALGMIGALALTPQARAPSPGEPGAFTGGGGSSGGAGTSGSF
jgi:hypothetical protein